MTWTYFAIEDEPSKVVDENDLRFVKIGRAGDPYRRAREMNTGNPRGLLPIVMVPMDIESQLHDALVRFAVTREWFAAGPRFWAQARAAVKELCGGLPVSTLALDPEEY